MAIFVAIALAAFIVVAGVSVWHDHDVDHGFDHDISHDVGSDVHGMVSIFSTR